MREQLIRKYVQTDQIYDIIGHDTWLYLLTWIQYCFLIFVLWLLYVYAIRPMNQPFLQTLRAWIGIFAYIKLMYDIFDEYLDTLIVTDKWLVHFRWDGLWKQKTDLLQWVSMESISHEQNSFFDSLVNKWDLTIKLEDTIVKFRDISSPAVSSNTIIEYKEKILWRHNYLENEQDHEHGKYNILIEALWEVVNDYVEKKKEDQHYY